MLNQNLIDKVQQIRTTLNEISVYNLDVKTSLELYYELAKKVNEVINELIGFEGDVVEEVKNFETTVNNEITRFENLVSEDLRQQNEKITYMLNEGLKLEVGLKIDDLIQDGTMDSLINHKIFNDLNTKIETYKQQTDEQFNTITNNVIHVISNNVDDTQQLQDAFDQQCEIILNDDYIVTSALYLKSNTVIKGTGTITCNNVENDCLSVTTSEENIKIKGIKIKNAKRFGIQVYGQTVDVKPNNIEIENVTTINCTQGGIFLNSCHDITVKNCNNVGGVRAIGTFAPISNPNDCYNITIDNCSTIDTIGFGYQTYYGKNITINNCVADGSKVTTQDRSCITIDRSTGVVVTNNLVKNAVSSNIFITGCDGVTVSNNVSLGGVYGIQCFYNNEPQEDSNIKENKNVVVANNIIKNATQFGIILNGCQNHNVISNSITDCGKAIYIMEEARTGDSVQMTTTNINIISNITNNDIELKPITGTCDFYLNVYKSLVGLATKNKVIDNTYFRNASKNIENIGLIKKENQAHDSWIFENRYTDESYHKGWYVQNAYGTINFIDSSGIKAFGINVSDGNNKKDIITYKAGAGLIVTSPNGLITKRLGISNAGEIVLTTV